ncbi:site-specific integrase [Ralstonia sp. CHL-2022]|uniref:Site-specific integrase n=1 Tax=Ralstonia mojiangensis TaxID=2953895 RepID=A0AAE3I732_9RALS|nr:site-specific integrase [Ralstonia mojiangensis]MCT7318659.1 site-specific integrase [Ralstonia mojiangensis]MCT7327367.1 site-specific integrase [Ralstonia mojiangensis]
MARLESVAFEPQHARVRGRGLTWIPAVASDRIDSLPQLFWANGLPWLEANQWFYERAANGTTSIKTVLANASALLGYANWLEETNSKWTDFPQRKANRCLVRFRGALIKARDCGRLAPSTVSARMRAVLAFYRWAIAQGLLSSEWPLWTDHVIGVHIPDPSGLHRSVSITTSDLSIPNRRAPGDCLEDGLLPISASDRDEGLELCRQACSQELFLFLTLGFFSGMRLGSLTDLKVETLTNAVPEPAAPAFLRLALGPAARPRVATKLGVSGSIWIPRILNESLLEYAHSTRRLLREAQAAPADRDLVFLTRYGNRYARRDAEKSPALNVEMHAFRKIAVAHGLQAWTRFRFHQSRVTFATELARIAIDAGGSMFALGIVKEALLHRSEAMTLRYIRFVEKIPVKAHVADDFTRNFLNLVKGKKGG